MTTNTIIFNVNGKDLVEQNVDPELTLASYLRNKLGLKGTKIGCEEGVCGSCTVVIGKWNIEENKAVYYSANACLTPVFQVNLCLVLTVEGIGSKEKIHPVQERLAKGHGTQCGFCSPGFVMSAYALLRNNPNPSIEEINDAIRGNRCRCTGYRPILEALYSFSNNSGGCCGGMINGTCCQEKDKNELEEKLLTFDDFPKYDPSQEIIFPPSLLVHIKKQKTESIYLKGARVELYAPNKLNEYLEIWKVHKPQIISSGLITRLLLSANPNDLKQCWLSGYNVSEISDIKVTDDEVTIGSGVSIQEFANIVTKYGQPKLAKAINSLLSKFSSAQVANVATWSGAIVGGLKSKESVSDVLTLFVTLDLNLGVTSRSGKFQSITAENFSNQLATEIENLAIVHVKFSRNDNRKLFVFKQGETIGADATVVNTLAAFDEKPNRSVRVFVGLAGKPIRLNEVENVLSSGNLTIDRIYNAFDKNLNVCKFLEHNADNIQSKTKLRIVKAALYRLHQFINNSLPEEEHQDIKYLQYFKPSDQDEIDPIGRPLANYYADRCTTGKAVFVNDMNVKDGVHLGFVLSTVPHAEIQSIDYSSALAIKGVVGYFDVKNVIGNNTPGLLPTNGMPDDTPIFADRTVNSIGQIIAVIAADDVETARRAAKLVKINYNLLPAVITIQDAIEKDSRVGDVQYYGSEAEEVEKALSANDLIILEGQVSGNGQEHFYMETQNCLVVPGEADEYIIHSSTQGCSYLQHQVAAVLGISANKVVVRTKRLGGGFGGKVTFASSIACAAAVVAKNLRQPVYACFNRRDDLIVTGKRHGFQSSYRIGIDKEGRVVGGLVRNYLNGGWSKDHTEGVTLVMSSYVADVYNLNKLRCEGYPLKTNTCSSTALRGYGFPQAKILTEGVMRRIAHETGTDLDEVKRNNFNVEGGVTFTGLTIYNDALVECWESCEKMADYTARKQAIKEFNSKSTDIKRGISMTAVRFSLPHPGPYSQGTALVQINVDGSVSISIGGTEMGQGLNTKILQVASRALNRPIETITILDMSTDKTANAPETGGSQNADTNGQAVIACCERLLSGLKPLIDQTGDWNKAVLAAFANHVPLQCAEYGLFHLEKYGMTKDDSPYNTTGAAAVEIELDCITGLQKLKRVDIVMDVGESLNPAIDIGQIEGAFMQGYGMITCENIEYDPKTGELLQNTSAKYKIPTAAMVPKDFRIKLLGANKNFEQQVYSSKGIGEPPLIMTVGGVHSALMMAIEDFRKQNRRTDFVESFYPLTTSKILSLCYPDN